MTAPSTQTATVHSSESTTSRGSDATLVRRFRSGDQSAAAGLYLRYAHRLRTLARQYVSPQFSGRFDSDDVVQSVFRDFFSGVNRKAYEVPPHGELWGLLMVLALNKIRSLVERHSAEKRAVRNTTSLDQTPCPALTTDKSAAALLKLVVDEHVDDLPLMNREIVRLRIDGYEVAEIAKQTRRSRRTVERVLQDFRNRLTRG